MIDCHRFSPIVINFHHLHIFESVIRFEYLLTKSCQYPARWFEDCVDQLMAIDAIKGISFVTINIGHRLADANRYQLTNNYRLILIDRLISDHRFSLIGHAGCTTRDKS